MMRMTGGKCCLFTNECCCFHSFPFPPQTTRDLHLTPSLLCDHTQSKATQSFRSPPIVNVYHHILYQEYAQLACILYVPPMFIVMD